MSFLKASLVVLALSGGVLGATAADAHAKLVASNPAANATVTGPARVQLRFDEKLVGRGSSFQLFLTARAGSKPVAPTPVAAVVSLAPDGQMLVAPLKRPLTSGAYLVAWHATTSDGERKNGTFGFTVR